MMALLRLTLCLAATMVNEVHSQVNTYFIQNSADGPSYGKWLSFDYSNADLVDKDTKDKVPWRLVPTGEVDTYYVENLWHGPAEPRYGNWLSFSYTNVDLCDKDNTNDKVPWRLVPTGEVDTYYFQNLWHGSSESRYGKWLSFSGTDYANLCGETDTANRVPWKLVPASQVNTYNVENSADGPSYGKWLSFSYSNADLSDKDNTKDKVPWRLVPAGEVNTYYFQNVWRGPCDYCYGKWLSFDYSNADLCDKDTKDKVPWRLVPTGEVDTYYFQNLWHGPAESRYGEWLSFSGTNVELCGASDTKNRVPWRLVADTSDLSAPFVEFTDEDLLARKDFEAPRITEDQHHMTFVVMSACVVGTAIGSAVTALFIRRRATVEPSFLLG